MPFFSAKPRSWEAYLAGIGASGVLMASALVLFVIMVGVVTLKTWPHAGALLGNRGSDVGLERTATPAPQTSAGSSNLNVVKLLGGSGTVAPHEDAGRGRLGGAGGGASPGGSTGPGLSDGVSEGAEPTRPASSRSSDPVSQLLSGAGNTVHSDTESLGNTLGGSSSQGLGGVVGGLGNTLNDTLQGLAGKR